jgi:hypothetical protein
VQQQACRHAVRDKGLSGAAKGWRLQLPLIYTSGLWGSELSDSKLVFVSVKMGLWVSVLTQNKMVNAGDQNLTEARFLTEWNISLKHKLFGLLLQIRLQNTRLAVAVCGPNSYTDLQIYFACCGTRIMGPGHTVANKGCRVSVPHLWSSTCMAISRFAHIPWNIQREFARQRTVYSTAFSDRIPNISVPFS